MAPPPERTVDLDLVERAASSIGTVHPLGDDGFDPIPRGAANRPAVWDRITDALVMSAFAAILVYLIALLWANPAGP